MGTKNTSTTVWDPLGDITLGVYGPFDGPTQDVAHIRDVDDQSAVPVGGIIGYGDDYLQAGLIVFAPMEFKYLSAWLSVGQYSDTIIAQRLSWLNIAPIFTDSGAEATIRMVYVDKTGRSVFSGIYTLAGLAVQDEDGNYLGEFTLLRTYGADRIGIYVESITAGKVACRMCCV